MTGRWSFDEQWGLAAGFYFLWAGILVKGLEIAGSLLRSDGAALARCNGAKVTKSGSRRGNHCWSR